MDEALKPIHRLAAEARNANEAAAKQYALEVEFNKLKKEEAAKKARTNIGLSNAADLAIDNIEEPKARRYVVNDATYEALGVILAANPNGTLAFRDELVSLLKTLDREEHVAARGFFLTAWNGTSGYTFDRIIRGKTHIEAACLSLLGSTQPGRLADYMRGALVQSIGVARSKPGLEKYRPLPGERTARGGVEYLSAPGQLNALRYWRGNR